MRKRVEVFTSIGYLLNFHHIHHKIDKLKQYHQNGKLIDLGKLSPEIKLIYLLCGLLNYITCVSCVMN